MVTGWLAQVPRNPTFACNLTLILSVHKVDKNMICTHCTLNVQRKFKLSVDLF